ncbi:MAG: DUF5714 domain-containing protein [Hadesarchaea archaeon]|nr:DUF5714 domain-containing protein [Hadesarchaea archaeon]
MHELRELKELRCYFCSEVGKSDVACKEEHFICESCRLANAEEAIERIGLAATEADPVRIADRMMKHLAIPVYGVEHHFIAAVAMFVAVKNLMGERVQAKDIKRLMKLMEKIPYGSCGFLGICGAAVGIGAAFSALLGANYMKDGERTLAMRAASLANSAIAGEGGPRCCVASVYTALYEASKMAREVLGLDLKLELPVGRCEFADGAEDCRRGRCRFFKGG